jgi:uncharacterized RDD family membrane protein YckC
MTAEPPPGQNPYESTPPPPPGGYPPPPGPGGYPPPPGYGPYGAPQGQPLPPGAPAPLAQWWERWVARIIDSLILGVVSLILSGIFNAIIGGVITYLAYAAYDYLLHSKDGQTLGKKVLKIQLVGVGGAALDSSALMKRSALFPGVMVLGALSTVLSSIAGLYALVLAILIIADQPLHQGLHDKVAGTIVVKAPR